MRRLMLFILLVVLPLLAQETAQQEITPTIRGLLVMGNEYGRSVAGAGEAISDSQSNMKTIATQTGGRYLVNRNNIDNAVAQTSSDGGVYYSLAYYPEKKRFDGGFRRISSPRCGQARSSTAGAPPLT